MAKFTIGIFIAAGLLVYTACGDKLQQEHDSTPAEKTSRMLSIRPDVDLEIVDWGGKGAAMVFLAGLGHTAHVFDGIAPKFIDEYRVLGLTRRGFGASSYPETGYTLDTLVDDIRVVLDSLDLTRVILVGHSLGGDEITRFATLYPDRLRGIVYLDAAYDRTTTDDTLANYPLPDIEWPEPTDEELKSVEGYQKFYRRSNGVLMPLKEIEEIYNWNGDGSFAGSRTPGSVYTQIRESLADPVYTGIDIPALAIYGVNYPVEELFIDFARADSSSQILMIAYYEASKRMAALSQQRFSAEMINGHVVEIEGAGHSLYITHAQQVEATMRGFLRMLDRPAN